MNEAIRIEKLTKSYGKERGVIDLDLVVEPGDVFGYLGPNGAGKTTTIRTLLDLIRPTSGRCWIFGLDCQKQSIEVHKRVGYVPGELALYPKLTGEQTVRHFAALRGGVDMGWVMELADRLDFDLKRHAKAYSSGNKRKLGLILALMSKPELLLLDEASGGLDPLVQQELNKILVEMREAGSTIFFSSHNLPEVERVCDRVAIIREGRLVAVEGVDDLKAKALRRIEIQFERPVPATTFEGLPGVQDVEVQDSRLTFTVLGSIDSIFKVAAQHTVNNVVSHEPSLEEVFLTFYEGGTQDAS
ncbi:MAG: ABC transporter ATP-binding protein [Anaerolineae bacterium]|nr:MAG: ABC transporter ATP-binding protein [Anaerolineae bacterium]